MYSTPALGIQVRRPHLVQQQADHDRSNLALDPDGISLVAIKALYLRVKELEEENSQLRKNIGQTDQRLDKLQQLVESELAKRASENANLAVRQ